MNIAPYFVDKQNQTWTGWNPYDRANPVRTKEKEGYEIKFLLDYHEFSFWQWLSVSSPGEINQIIIFNNDELEVGYLGYYTGGYCVSLYVDTQFRRRGLGTKMLECVPELKVFQEEVGSFNKKLNKEDPLLSREYLLQWYSKRKVLR